jgi:hypothetical protein
VLRVARLRTEPAVPLGGAGHVLIGQATCPIVVPARGAPVATGDYQADPLPRSSPARRDVPL